MHVYEIASLARDLMNQHGLTDWAFGWSNRKRNLGMCWYDRKLIDISIHYARNNSIDLVRDTILHEIAHALAGPQAGHGFVWQAICIRIGAKPQRCKYADEVNMPYNYLAHCACNIKHTMVRRVKRRYICAKCRTELNFLPVR